MHPDSFESDVTRQLVGGEKTVLDAAADALRNHDDPPNDGLTRLAEQVRQTEDLVRRIIADSGNCIQVLSIDGRVLSVNPPGPQTLGVEKENISGGLWVDWWDHAFREEAEETLHKAVRDGSARFFAPVRTRAGVKWWDTIVTLMRGDGVQPDHLLANSRDITAVKYSEGALAQKEQNLRLLVESIKEYAIFTLDLEGFITSWNPGAARVFNYAASEIVGQSAMILWTPEDRDAGGPEHEMATATMKGWAEDERWHLRKDGTRFFASGTLNAIYDAAGNLAGFTKICRDVTEKRNLELERNETLAAERSARAEAERASRLKDDFLATLSHELRTPLNAILGWTQVLRSSARSPDDIEQGLNTIERNARAQTQIIEDLLEMSRIISGKIRLDLQRIDLGSVVEAAIETVRPTAEVKG
ncbi:MAG: PAS domain S-box protein, partial [Thermomicrobiales bacterium]